MATTRKTTALALAALTALGALGWAQANRGDGQTERRRQELKLELLRERARIIREEPAAAALKERIEVLQLDLAKLVDSQPSVQRLQAELAAVEQILERQARGRSNP